MKKILFNIYIPMIFLSALLFIGCDDVDESKEEIEINFIKAEYVSSEKISVALIFNDKEERISEIEVNQFVENANYKVNSDGSIYNIILKNPIASVSNSGSGLFKALISASMEITKDGNPVNTLSDLSGNFDISIAGNLIDVSYELSGRISYEAESDSTPLNNNPDSVLDDNPEEPLTEDGAENTGNTGTEDGTENTGTEGGAENTGTVDGTENTGDSLGTEEFDNPPFILLSAVFSNTDKAELIFEVNDPAIDTDSIDFFSFNQGSVAITSFDNQNIEINHNNNTSSKYVFDGKTHIQLLANLSISGITVTSMEDLNGRFNVNYSMVYNQETLEFSKEFDLKSNNTGMKGVTNIFVAGITDDTIFNTNQNQSFYGETPLATNVEGKEYVFFDGSGDIFHSNSISVPIDGIFDGQTGVQFWGLNSPEEKDNLFTTESGHIMSVGYVSCVFLGAEPKTYTQRKNLGEKVSYDYTRAPFNYTTADSYNYIGITDGLSLHQVFFVGDGKSGNGDYQKYKVPEGAVNLYCGVIDGADAFDDNSGTADFVVYSY